MQALLSFFQQELKPAQHRKLLLFLGHFTFLVMGILSLVYFKERTCHFDSANYAFHMIFTDEHYTGHNRYINYVPQLLPMLLQDWGASLKTILMTYSFNFVFQMYLVFLLIAYCFKNPLGGLFLALAITLAVRYKFYAPVGEVRQGIVIIALIMGWLMSEGYQAEGRRLLKVGFAAVLSSIMLVVHPFPMSTLGLVWMAWMIYTQRWKIWQEWLLPVAWAIMWGIKFGAKGSGTSYEQGRAEALFDTFKVIGNLSDYYIWDRFQWYFRAHYTLTAVLFVGALIYLCYKKKWITTLWIVLSFVIMSVLILSLNAYLNAPIYLITDGYMAHLGVIMAIGFVLSLGRNRQLWAAMVFMILLGFSLDRIRGSHEFFSNREDLLMGMIERNATPEAPKLLAHMEGYDWKRLWHPWAVGLETLMLTHLNTPGAPKTMYFQQHHEKWAEEKLADPKLYLGLHYGPEFFKAKDAPQVLSIPDGVYKKIDVKGTY